jgi:hypothetical protein
MSAAPSVRTETHPRTAQAVFLERDSYRRRRLADISRLLPLIGVLLLLVPLLWTGADTGAVTAGDATPLPMSKAITYIFAVWAMLIIAAVLFAMAARRWGVEGGDVPGTRPAPSGSGQG